MYLPVFAMVCSIIVVETHVVTPGVALEWCPALCSYAVSVFSSITIGLYSDCSTHHRKNRGLY
jgi:hypothetical protein